MCEDLFTATQVVGLSDKRAQLITRRGTSLHPLSEKLIEDMWYFADCISSKKIVRRVMYKSGKRSAEYLQKKLSDNDVPVSSLPPVSTSLTSDVSLTTVSQQVFVNTQPTSEILHTSVPQQVFVNPQPNYAGPPTSQLSSTSTAQIPACSSVSTSSQSV